MKHSATAWLAFGLLATGSAMAHVGIANNTLPLSAAGQSAYTVNGQSSEIVLLVPHGCNSEAVPAVDPAADTTKIEITVPAAIVTATGAASVRPLHTGEFGNVARETLGDGSIKFTWSKIAAASLADDQFYKVSFRLKTPAVTDTAASDYYAIKKYQFHTVQTCRIDVVDYVLDWDTSSPTLLSFPDKRKGFNKYTLDSSTVADFAAASGTATKAAKLKNYFGDAAIVWVGKRGYSANPNTVTKINALIAEDLTYSDLGTEQGVSLDTDDVLWVKY